jgi:hypothetical protein
MHVTVCFAKKEGRQHQTVQQGSDRLVIFSRKRIKAMALALHGSEA